MGFLRAGRVRTGWAALGLFALTACQDPERPPPPCPNIVIVQDAAELTQFLPGPGRDLTDVTLEARISDFRGFCDTDVDDDDGTGTVEVEMQLILVATRGPASTSREATLRYFVAIADTEENILAREEFETTIAFERNRNRVALGEDLTQKIPLRGGQLGDAFNIFVGFQLSDADLKYNRNKRGR